MDKILKLQKDNQGHYANFVEYFLSAVIGKQDYNKVKHKSLLSSYATSSDESFALIVLENNIERWIDMHEQNNQKSSTVMPKYTNAGKTKYHQNGSSNQRYKGWSAKGLKRYNKLFELVRNDRKKPYAVEWEESFRLRKEEQFVSENINKRKRLQSEDEDFKQIKTCHDLWDDNSVDSTNSESKFSKGGESKWKHNTSSSESDSESSESFGLD